MITDFTLIKDSPEYHHRFKLTDNRNGAEFGDIIEINTLELPKLPEKESWDDLLIWLEFFRAKTEDDFMKVAKLNPQVERAVVIIRELSKDEQARFIAERDEKRRLDISSMKNFALRQGISEGLQQGISQGIQQGKQEGRLEGLHEGIQQGIVQGLKQGISQGIQQGKQEAQVDMLKLIDEGLTIKQIRERLSGR